MLTAEMKDWLVVVLFISPIYSWLTNILKVDEDIAVTFLNELYSPTYMRYERAKQEKISTSFDCGPNFSENFY